MNWTLLIKGEENWFTNCTIWKERRLLFKRADRVHTEEVFRLQIDSNAVGRDERVVFRRWGVRKHPVEPDDDIGIDDGLLILDVLLKTSQLIAEDRKFTNSVLLILVILGDEEVILEIAEVSVGLRAVESEGRSISIWSIAPDLVSSRMTESIL